MKYINSLVFLSLLIFVAGCQKKDNQAPRKGPTKLETRSSAAQKRAAVEKDVKKMMPHDHGKKSSAGNDHKKNMKKDDHKKMAAKKSSSSDQAVKIQSRSSAVSAG